MKDIVVCNRVVLPLEVINKAINIISENVSCNWPHLYVKHLGNNEDVISQLAEMLDCSCSDVDYVYFSSRIGAKPHVDQLPTKWYGDTSIIVPIILPDPTSNAKNVLTVGNDSIEVEVGGSYKFLHQTIHSFSVSSDTGCVLIMAAKRI